MFTIKVRENRISEPYLILQLPIIPRIGESICSDNKYTEKIHGIDYEIDKNGKLIDIYVHANKNGIWKGF